LLGSDTDTLVHPARADRLAFFESQREVAYSADGDAYRASL
jgi:hypothetical protein